MFDDNVSNLKEHLKTLRADLARTGEVDAELEELLRELDDDIRHKLERPAGEQAETITYGLAERSQELTARFAVRHPRLEPALRELGNMLASMGI